MTLAAEGRERDGRPVNSPREPHRADAGIGLPARKMTVLLVEDDRADALLVEELIADTAADIDCIWSRTIADAELSLLAHRPDCVLLDLNLPDADGIDALHRVGRLDPGIPIIVLTGLSDEHFGVSAVASGAQDYLVKGLVDPEMLRRAVLYAIERKRAELTSVDLRASQLRALENARLERGLLPSPLLFDKPGVDLVTRSLPTRRDALLGGDFYDVVQTPDGTVHVMIGDVSGHGPDEAALGVALRIGWRSLTFAGLRGNDRMRQLDRLLTTERPGRGTFATLCSVALDPVNGGFDVVRAGHPGLLLHGGGAVEWLEPPAGPALGLGAREWPVNRFVLDQGYGLVLLTDGLFEGHAGRGAQRLGEEGLLSLARTVADYPGPDFVDAVISQVAARAQPQGGLTDDIAVIRVERSVTPEGDC